MSLTSSPFHPTTGELLPGYRDAYLRGDLSGTNNSLVDAYLKANPQVGTAAFERFHTLRAKGHHLRPVGWLHAQFELLRTEPARFRRRAGTLVLGAALLSGAVLAGVRPMRPALPIGSVILAETPASTASLSTREMRTVRGRILDENGHPLAGATVLDKRNGQGVGTDAQGSYVLVLPAGQAATLQYGYGGYAEEEMQVSGGTTHNVTLLPRADRKKAKRWWLF